MPRTTLTLDPDVAKLIEDAVHRERRPTKQVVNDALRRGLAPATRRAAKPYRLTPHHAEVRPGFDLTSLNRLVDEVDADVFVAETRGGE
jgi:hypothetical protein